MHYPKISIITPSLNQGLFIENTITSVLNQNYPNLEYIIIDGGSTDNTINIIKKYEKQIHYWHSKKDNGLYDALQQGFNLSSGDILAWINSDDIYYHNSLFIIAEIFTTYKEIQWLQGCPTSINENGATIAVYSPRKWSKYNFYKFDYKWIPQESCFWTRSLWEKSGACFDNQIKFAGDLYLWLQFFKQEQLYITNALIGGFRFRTNNQISKENMNDYIAEAETLIKKELKNLKKKEKIKLLFIKVIEKISTIFHISILNRYLKNKLYAYPPFVTYQRELNKFIFY